MKHIVGLIGAIGSGTSSAKKFLEEAGFKGYSYGAEVADYISADSSRGGRDRKNLQYWGHKALEAEENNNFWDVRIFEKIHGDKSLSDGRKGVVLDSLKYDFQINFWRDISKDRFGFHLIGVDAAEVIRFPRLVSRGREGDPKTKREFDEANSRDLYGYRRDFGQDTAHCTVVSKFDVQLWNDKKPEDFREGLLYYFREKGIL